MANDDFPRGLLPLRVCCINAYKVSTASDIYLGAPVTLDSNGIVVLGNTAVNVDYIGVAVGFLIGRSGAPLETAPFLDVSALSTADVWALVADDPKQEYVVQADTGGSAITEAGLGTGAVLTGNATPGNTSTGWSTIQLDRSTIGTGTDGTVRILRLHGNVNSDGTQNTYGNFDKYVVRIIRHQLGAQQSGTQVVA